MNNNTKIMITICIIVMLFALLYSPLVAKVNSTPQADQFAAWDAGEGFEKFKNRDGIGVAYSVKKDGIYIKSQRYCEHMFITANAYKKGTVVADAIDTANHVQANQQAKVEIGFNYGDYDSWRITDITCY